MFFIRREENKSDCLGGVCLLVTFIFKIVSALFLFVPFFFGGGSHVSPG